MGNTLDRTELKQDIRRRLLEGPVQVHADDLSYPLLEWRSAVREAAQELGRPVTVYANTDRAWAALVDEG